MVKIAKCIDLVSRVLNTQRYEIDRQVGRGTWGAVYSGKDTVLDEEVAIKVLDPTDLAREQMEYRNLTSFEALRKEGKGLAACSHVVPRRFEIDNNGTPFIVMPLYDHFLSDLLRDDLEEKRIYVGKGLHEKTAYGYLLDISKGITEMHDKLRRVHGDLKPDNLALDRDSRILINDLGTSTCTSIGKSISPRDNMGFIYTRSYKSFKEGEHPTKADDVFGIGSLTYRLFTGKYLFEDEINKSIDPKLFFEQLGQKGVEELLKKKLKKIPRNLRKFVKKCTEYNSWNRYQSGFEAQISLEKIIKRTSENDSYKRYLKRSVPYVVTSALLGYLAYGIATFEPTKIDLPIQQGQYISLDHLPKENPVIFVREDLKNLPEAAQGLLFNSRIGQHLTNNKNVAALLNSYNNELLQTGYAWMKIVTDAQHKMYIEYTTPRERSLSTHPHHLNPVKTAIEVAIQKSKTPDGRVDLEDACAIARVGLETINKAKHASNSRDFADYIEAKDDEGKYIIPEKEQHFIKGWLAHINSTY